ncbi:8031_t:CDS:2 [Racocetra persica]|uniref:8031_t:CDS:1 n=1 Tax=Racocetra persica TaxID=160502 RepID=A0ACA9KCW8_9GLOM|nr:8031_t:CDS:2 [Racocetra persica]
MEKNYRTFLEQLCEHVCKDIDNKSYEEIKDLLNRCLAFSMNKYFQGAFRENTKENDAAEAFKFTDFMGAEYNIKENDDGTLIKSSPALSFSLIKKTIHPNENSKECKNENLHTPIETSKIFRS